MAENVNTEMEKMLSAFEGVKRIKIFSEEERRELIKRCKEHEYKINGSTKDPQHYKDYIAFAKNILEKIRLKRSKMRVGEKHDSIEQRIITRIKSLYDTAIQRFPRDKNLAISYFRFCNHLHWPPALNSSISHLLNNHSDCAEVFQIIARWYANDRKDIAAAINYVRKGIALHKETSVLYTEIIELEIFNAVGQNWSKKTSLTEELTEKEKICIEKLQTYIKEVIGNVADWSYLLKLLKYFEKYNFTLSVQNRIIEHLLTACSNEPEVWHSLAQREVSGVHYSAGSLDIVGKTKLRNSFKKYTEGLAQVPPSKKKDLWTLYIDHLIEQRQNDSGDFGVPSSFITTELSSAFENACSEGYMAEKHFISWFEFAKDEALQILEKGVAMYPQSLDLWNLRLKYEIMKDDVKVVDNVFQTALSHLHEKALPLWTARIRYHLLTSTEAVIEETYRAGIEQPKEISDVLKPRFLEWLALERGLDVARKEYSELSQKVPHCKDLHLIMSKLEATETDYDFIAWEEVHKNACKQFGKEDVDVWINYILFYCHYKKVGNYKECIKGIYDEARKNLSSDMLRLNFHNTYNNKMGSVP